MSVDDGRLAPAPRAGNDPAPRAGDDDPVARAAPAGEQSLLGADRLKHLEFVQAVVGRLGTSSFLVKGWTLTIAAALFALLANKLDDAIAMSGLVPIVAFWFLDGYFLWQERLFRSLYDDARRPDTAVEPMAMDTRPYHGGRNTWPAATFSMTLVLFYGALVVIDIAITLAAVAARK